MVDCVLLLVDEIVVGNDDRHDDPNNVEIDDVVVLVEVEWEDVVVDEVAE